MHPVRIEAPYVPADGFRLTTLITSGAMVVAGVVLGFTTASLRPLGLCLAGTIVYAVLLRRHPGYVYVPVLEVDHHGITYHAAPKPGSRCTLYPWKDIKKVKACLVSAGHPSSTSNRHFERFPAIDPIRINNLAASSRSFCSGTFD